MSQTIAPSKVESTLTAIWGSLQAANKMRASLFNLIIYTPQNHRTTYFASIAQKVIEKFPSRILFVTSDPHLSPSDLKTAVSVLTAKSEGNIIACDLIEMSVPAKNEHSIPFLLLPYILPDLPIYLVYGDDPTKTNPSLSQLEELADRIIFDSEGAQNLGAFASCMLQKNHEQTYHLTDLNWGRIEEWRQLFAHVFKWPEELDLLKKAETITISFNHHREEAFLQTMIPSIYLQSWLASSLGWKLQSSKKNGESLHLRYKTEGEIFEFHLHPEKISSLSPGNPIAITIKTKEGIFFSFRRKKEVHHHILLEKWTEERCFLPTTFIFEKDESGKSLVAEICQKGTSAHYLRTIAEVSKIK